MTDLTRFDSNSILFENNPNPKPPSNSNSIKVFQRNGELFKINFAGQVTPLNNLEVSYYQTTVEADADEARFTFSVPNPNKIVKELRNDIEAKLGGLGDEFRENFNSLQRSITELQADLSFNIEASRNAFESVEDDILYLIKSLNQKVDKDQLEIDMNSIKEELDSLVISIMESMSLKANRSELETLSEEIKNQFRFMEIDGGVIRWQTQLN